MTGGELASGAPAAPSPTATENDHERSADHNVRTVCRDPRLFTALISLAFVLDLELAHT